MESHKKIKKNEKNLHSKPKKEFTSVNAGYEAAGGFGSYQKRILLATGLSTISGIFFMFALPLLQTFPNVYSTDGQNKLFGSAEEACSAGNYKYENKHFNFISEYDLICHGSYSTWMTITFALGIAIGYVFFTIVSDLVGRTSSINFGLVCMIISCVFILKIFNSFIGCIIVCFIFGCAYQAVGPYSYLLASESAEEKHTPFIQTYINVISAIGQILVSLLLLGQFGWQTVCVCMFFCYILSFAAYFFIGESPVFLIERNYRWKAAEKLKEIAKINGVKLSEEISFSVVSIKRSMAYHLIGYDIFQKNAVLYVVIMSVTCGMVYFRLSMNMHQFGGNPYWNAIFNGISEIIAVFATVPIQKIVGLKCALISLYMIMGFSFLEFELIERASPGFLMYLTKFCVSFIIYYIHTQVVPIFPEISQHLIYKRIIMGYCFGLLIAAILLGLHLYVFQITSIILVFASIVPTLLLPNKH